MSTAEDDAGEPRWFVRASELTERPEPVHTVHDPREEKTAFFEPGGTLEAFIEIDDSFVFCTGAMR